MRRLLPLAGLVASLLLACSPSSSPPGSSHDAGEDATQDAGGPDTGIPASLDCVANGGTCEANGQGFPGCPAGSRVADSLECAGPEGMFPVCCIPIATHPPDVCDLENGVCTLPGSPCPTGSSTAPQGCASSGALSQCCLPQSACVQLGGRCVGTGTACTTVGSTFQALQDAPESELCPQTAQVCCIVQPIDACGQAGGQCTSSGFMVDCPQPLDAGCARPASIGTYGCCGG